MDQPNPSGRKNKALRPLSFTGEAAFREHRRTAKRFEYSAFTAFILPSVDAHWHFAVVASKVRIGNAVERNRAKRRLRAAFVKIQKTSPKPLSVMLYAKKNVLTADFAEILQNLEQIFQNFE